jgi:hypothetical protein
MKERLTKFLLSLVAAPILIVFVAFVGLVLVVLATLLLVALPIIALIEPSWITFTYKKVEGTTRYRKD